MRWRLAAGFEGFEAHIVIAPPDSVSNAIGHYPVSFSLALALPLSVHSLSFSLRGTRLPLRRGHVKN